MPIVLFAKWRDLRDELVAYVVDEVRRSIHTDVHTLTTTILEMIMSNQEHLDASAAALATQFAEVQALIDSLRADVVELKAAAEAAGAPLDFTRLDAGVEAVADAVPDPEPVPDPAPAEG